MGVKRSQSGSRMLSVFEEVAQRQPIGVSELARLMVDDKSSIQRALMTLADAGWIEAAPGKPGRWQASGRILALARHARPAEDLREQAGPTLQALRDSCGETVLLILLDGDGFVVADAWESRQMLRTSPRIGMPISAHNSATARAVLPYLDAVRQTQILGHAPEPAESSAFALTLARGYSVSSGEVMDGGASIAAPIFDEAGLPLGVVAISGPSDRLTAVRHAELGAAVIAAARALSRGEPAEIAPLAILA